MSQRLAARVEKECGDDRSRQVRRAWQLALHRSPSEEEQRLASDLAAKHGLPTLCRALFNSNEFVVIE